MPSNRQDRGALVPARLPPPRAGRRRGPGFNHPRAEGVRRRAGRGTGVIRESHALASRPRARGLTTSKQAAAPMSLSAFPCWYARGGPAPRSCSHLGAHGRPAVLTLRCNGGTASSPGASPGRPALRASGCGRGAGVAPALLAQSGSLDLHFPADEQGRSVLCGGPRPRRGGWRRPCWETIVAIAPSEGSPQSL